MALKIGDKFESDSYRPSKDIKIFFEVCFIVLLKDKINIIVPWFIYRRF